MIVMAAIRKKENRSNGYKSGQQLSNHQPNLCIHLCLHTREIQRKADIQCALDLLIFNKYHHWNKLDLYCRDQFSRSGRPGILFDTGKQCIHVQIKRGIPLWEQEMFAACAIARVLERDLGMAIGTRKQGPWLNEEITKLCCQWALVREDWAYEQWSKVGVINVLLSLAKKDQWVWRLNQPPREMGK